jgi:hypothetical protein
MTQVNVEHLTSSLGLRLGVVGAAVTQRFAKAVAIRGSSILCDVEQVKHDSHTVEDFRKFLESNPKVAIDGGQAGRLSDGRPSSSPKALRPSGSAGLRSDPAVTDS